MLEANLPIQLQLQQAALRQIKVCTATTAAVAVVIQETKDRWQIVFSEERSWIAAVLLIVQRLRTKVVCSVRCR